MSTNKIRQASSVVRIIAVQTITRNNQTGDMVGRGTGMDIVFTMVGSMLSVGDEDIDGV